MIQEYFPVFVEEGGQSILLTGDARWDQVIEGLEATGLLEPGKSMEVDVVKVPHHGSENNIVETDLLDRVIGQDYIFCGDGFSGNPELDVIEDWERSPRELNGRARVPTNRRHRAR